MESQLTILSERLDRKLEVLQMIQEYNKRQEEVFSAEKVDIRQFDAAVEEKQHLIDEVVRLDDGFEILYEKLAKELEGNRQRYAAQNKKLVENYFARERAGIGQRRKSAKSAFDYYKSMSGAEYVPPQMYDNKQLIQRIKGSR